MKAGGGSGKSRGRKAAARKRGAAPKPGRVTKAARVVRPAKAKAENSAKADAERLGRELAEARERQAATAEVLSLITDSPTDLQPIFDRIVKNAARLCQSVLSAVYRRDGDQVHLVAHDKFSAEIDRGGAEGLPCPACQQEPDLGRDSASAASCTSRMC